MALVQLLGILDIAVGVLIIAEGRFDLPTRLIFFGAIYLIIKGVAFWRSIVSWVDASLGLFLLLLMMINMPFLSLVIGIYLIIKGGSSLL